MSVKYFAAILALCLAQGFIEAKSIKKNDIINSFEELIIRLKSDINRADIQATASLTKYVEELSVYGNGEFIDKLMKEINSGIDSNINEINKKVEESAEAGVDVTACLVVDLEKIENLGERVDSNLRHVCVPKSITNAYEQVMATSWNIQHLDNVNVTKFENDFNDCRIKEDVCMQKVLDDAITFENTLVAAITELYTEGYYFVNNYIKIHLMPNIAGGITKGGYNNLAALRSKITRCILAN